MRSIPAWLLVLPYLGLACSADSFTPADAGPGSDAAVGPEGGGNDGGLDAAPTPQCKIGAPWGAPKLMPWMPGDAGAPITLGGTVRFDRDEKVGVFDEGNSGIWFGTRVGDTLIGKNPFAIQLAGQSYHPTIDGAAKRVWFANDSTTVLAIYTQMISSSGVASLAASVVGHALAFPYVLPSGDVLYAVSDDPSAPVYRFPLTVATGVAASNGEAVTGSDKWPADFRSGAKRPQSVAVSSDEKEMVLGTGNTSGTAHLYLTQRAAVTDDWPIPAELLFADGTIPETPDWLSVDHCHVYFRGYQGNLRAVFVAARAP